MIAAEDLLGAIASEVLNNVSVFATAIVAAAGVSLGIFVGKDRTGCLKDSFRDKVLAGNHLKPLVLAEGLVVKSCGNFRVGLGKGERDAICHIEILSFLP
jgi:hypothetical protein